MAVPNIGVVFLCMPPFTFFYYLNSIFKKIVAIFSTNHFSIWN